MNLETDSKRMFVEVQYAPNGRTPILCIFIGAGESVILREIAVVEDNPKTGYRWYDRVKESVEYIGRNWMSSVFVGKLLAFVWDIFCGK